MTCLFCRIARGEIPAKVVLDEPDVMAFRDISPVAPVHVLVIPKAHICSLADVAEEHGALLGKIMQATRKVAELEGVSASGFRAIINNGADANQTVPHLHVHVIGRRVMKWPPG